MALGEAGTGRLHRPPAEIADGERGARALRPGELAWIAALPCALLVLGLMLVVGPPLGRIVLPDQPVTFWPSVLATKPPTPEPTEQGRYLLALTAPLLLTTVVLLGVRRRLTLRAATIARLVAGTQLLSLAFVVVCVVVQRRHVFSSFGTPAVPQPHAMYFTATTLVVAGLLALAIGVGLASEAASERFHARTRERRGLRIAGAGMAVVAIALWLLPAINFEDTIADAYPTVATHLPFWLDEAFAVLDRRFPLVDFAAQYGSLWPYPVAGAMVLLGSSIGVFTVVTAVIGGGAMLALFATFRRLVRSSVAALLLFVPFLATSLFVIAGPLANRYAVSNLFSTFPLRYAGPLLVAWLVARHLDGASPRRSWGLFLASGLALLNNVDFGVPALGATLAALLWTSGRVTGGVVARLAVQAAIGLAAAFASVSVLTLALAGSLPHLDLLFRYSRVFAVAGWGALPMRPAIGLSTIIYLTYVAAIGAATVRAVSSEADRLMTGLLAWSGVFGLGIGTYYMGRSHPEVLVSMFGAWALSVTLLFVLAVRSVAARSSRRPTLAEAACLFAFGVLVCSAAQMPLPWAQVERLQRTAPAVYAQPVGQAFIAAHARPGEPVAIMTQLGHRAAYDIGIVDVTPYTGNRSMPTVDQFDDMLDALQAAGGRKVFVAVDDIWSEIPGALEQRGYELTADDPGGMAEFARSP